ncbi:pheromone-regulated protein PRM2 LALA0_S08e03422g [Lachancea lanzarotensis]|uniref:LALA0S08e03422g1_1 n=1 Tax=Lachancea lanzarotensis TaxID=1245769 RepID=A0A0C7N066_9SACH|nr:uncharacterized protein LALA0_S08e03422g [Lachancea lanzarotensis]CEP63479.1 LALA0S08e03422g1_1 [Lachancea lanzarotensis]
MRANLDPFPALRYRLLNCIFSPYVLLPHATFFITLWLMVAFQKDKDTLSEAPTTFTTTATVTAAPRTQKVTLTANFTASTTSSYSPTSSSLEPKIDDFLAAKANDAAQVLNGVLQGYVTNINSKVANWNTSIKTQLSIWEQHFTSLQQYNQSIFSNLESQSRVLDSTVQYLTSNGLLVTAGNSPSNLEGLELNVSFLENIFSNVSANLGELRSGVSFYPKYVTLMSITSSETEAWLSNSTEVQSSLQSLKDSLQSASNTTGSKSVVKRSESIILIKRNRRQKGVMLSALFSTTYIVCTILVMCLEYLIFRIEMSRIRWTSEHLVVQSWEKINFDNTIYRLQAQGDIQNTLTPYAYFAKYPMACTSNEIMINAIERTISPSSRKRPRVQNTIFFLHWWLASHGVAIWLFLVTFLVEGRIIGHFLVTSSEVDSGPIEKRSNTFLRAETANNSQISSLCTAFETVVNTELYTAANNRLWGVQNNTVATVYDKMLQQLQQTGSESPFLEIAFDTTLGRSEFQFANFSSFLASGLSNSFPKTADTDLLRLSRRDLPSNKSSGPTKYRKLHAKIVWTLLGFVFIHHSCGFLLALLSCKNPVILSSEHFLPPKNRLYY